MRYETSAFDKYPNERAMLRNAMADLRFAAWEYLKANGYELEKQEALEFVDCLRDNDCIFAKDTPTFCMSIYLAKRAIVNAHPKQAKQEFLASWHKIQTIHEQTRLIQKAAG